MQVKPHYQHIFSRSCRTDVLLGGSNWRLNTSGTSSEVGYTIATTRRETTKVHKNMWWHWIIHRHYCHHHRLFCCYCCAVIKYEGDVIGQQFYICQDISLNPTQFKINHSNVSKFRSYATETGAGLIASVQ